MTGARAIALARAGARRSPPAVPTRGFLGDVLLSAIEVVTGVGKGKAADFVVTKAVQHVDDQVTAGLYALARESLPPAQRQRHAARAGAGRARRRRRCSCSCTARSQRPPARSASCGHSIRSTCARCSPKYSGRVYGLEHPTLGVSPIRQRADAGSRCPKGARLHLVTHSRGGLVAEVLARVCANPKLELLKIWHSSREPSTRRSATR